MKPFGIIMPNWNKEKYIGEAIDSVLAQTDPDWRLVIADDQSTDGSMGEIWRRLDERISLMTLPHQGPGAASRAAVETARTLGIAVVGVLDSDDSLHPDAVSIVRQAYLDHPACGLVHTQNWRCDAGMKRIEPGRAWDIPAGETALSLHEKEHILRVNHWLTFSLEAYDRTAGFAALQRHQDMDLIFKLEEVTKLHFVGEALYNYRITEEGLHTGKTVKDFAPEVRMEAWRRRGGAPWKP